MTAKREQANRETVTWETASCGKQPIGPLSSLSLTALTDWPLLGRFFSLKSQDISTGHNWRGGGVGEGGVWASDEFGGNKWSVSSLLSLRFKYTIYDFLLVDVFSRFNIHVTAYIYHARLLWKLKLENSS